MIYSPCMYIYIYIYMNILPLQLIPSWGNSYCTLYACGSASHASLKTKAPVAESRTEDSSQRMYVHVHTQKANRKTPHIHPKGGTTGE